MGCGCRLFLPSLSRLIALLATLGSPRCASGWASSLARAAPRPRWWRAGASPASPSWSPAGCSAPAQLSPRPSAWSACGSGVIAQGRSRTTRGGRRPRAGARRAVPAMAAATAPSSPEGFTLAAEHRRPGSPRSFPVGLRCQLRLRAAGRPYALTYSATWSRWSWVTGRDGRHRLDALLLVAVGRLCADIVAARSAGARTRELDSPGADRGMGRRRHRPAGRDHVQPVLRAAAFLTNIDGAVNSSPRVAVAAVMLWLSSETRITATNGCCYGRGRLLLRRDGATAAGRADAVRAGVHRRRRRDAAGAAGRPAGQPMMLLLMLPPPLLVALVCANTRWSRSPTRRWPC